MGYLFFIAALWICFGLFVSPPPGPLLFVLQFAAAGLAAAGLLILMSRRGSPALRLGLGVHRVRLVGEFIILSKENYMKVNEIALLSISPDHDGVVSEVAFASSHGDVVQTSPLTAEFSPSASAAGSTATVSVTAKNSRGDVLSDSVDIAVDFDSAETLGLKVDGTRAK